MTLYCRECGSNEVEPPVLLCEECQELELEDPSTEKNQVRNYE